METQDQLAVQTITYLVNGEKQRTQSHKLSVQAILSNAGFTPAENYTLERDEGHHRYSDYNEEIALHEDERFTAIYKGPTPVSYASGMTNEELEAYLRGLGWNVESLQGGDGQTYIVIRDYTIRSGSLAGTTCDVAILRTTSVPYIPPAAIHTRPGLIPMGTRNTQASGIGSEWQYWSRAVREQTPKGMVTHIATIFSEV